MSSGDERDRGYVQSLDRGLSVIRALSAPGPGQTLADVARATGLTRAAARRFLLTLERLGYVRSDARLFSLTPRVLELGYAYLSSMELPEIAQPHLQELVERVHESSSVSVLEGDEVVYVARVPTSRRIMTVTISVGTRFPAFVTSMGRVLLAGLSEEERLARGMPVQLADELERVRRQGWALVDQELEIGLRSVAAPIRDVTGRVVAAVNLSSHASRRTLDDVRRNLLGPLLETATAIEADLSTPSAPPAPAVAAGSVAGLSPRR